MPMDALQSVISMVGGGLAGGALTLIFNRKFQRQTLRKQFYPKLSHMHADYKNRLAVPEGRYWVHTIGKPNLPQDENFVRHRADFIARLIEFIELGEVQKLRTKLTSPSNQQQDKNETITFDLLPESEAITACVSTIKKKLKLA